MITLDKEMVCDFLEIKMININHRVYFSEVKIQPLPQKIKNQKSGQNKEILIINN